MTVVRLTAMALALLHVASAHIRLQSPKPFGFLTEKSYNMPNYPNPLGTSVGNGETPIFPCQGGPSYNYDFSSATQIAAGNTTVASFLGEVTDSGHTEAAVHGGGSCQFSLSKTASANPQDWKVIKTYIGGCPASAVGNIGPPTWQQCSGPNTNETECLKSYSVEIPVETPSGKYFFAWTWFNKIGNREMYMGCAPIEVTNGGSDFSFLDTLPSIFVANNQGQPCITGQGGVLGIPNPGMNVVVSDYDSDEPKDVVFQPCSAVYGNGDVSKAPNFPKKGNAGGSIPKVVYIPMPAAGAEQTPLPGPPQQSVTSSAAPSPTTGASYTSVRYATIYVTASPIVAAPGASQPLGSGSCAAGKVPCTGEGDMTCISPVQFGICDHGCMVPQAVAPGTNCVDGVIVAANAKRDAAPVDTLFTRRWFFERGL